MSASSPKNSSIARYHLEDPITMYMKQGFCQLDKDDTVEKVLEALRLNPPKERILYFYVVDSENTLQGVVPTRRLLLSQLHQSIAQIMIQPVIAIPEEATVLDACEFFTLHRLLAFPIVDKNRQLLGVVDVDLYTEEIIEVDRNERNEELFQLIGVHLSESQQMSPWKSFQGRFPWLLCNIGGGILAALLSGFYEAELKKAVSLALFIPVVLALAESVSIQSLSIAIRGIHGPKKPWKAIFKKLRLESFTGTLLGIACALSVALIAGIWLKDFKVVTCLFGGIFGGVIVASILGVAVPSLLHQTKLDPQIASGPMVLACTDILTLFIYFNLARFLFS